VSDAKRSFTLRGFLRSAPKDPSFLIPYFTTNYVEFFVQDLDERFSIANFRRINLTDFDQLE
jgi:hypothetical protein